MAHQLQGVCKLACYALLSYSQLIHRLNSNWLSRVRKVDSRMAVLNIKAVLVFRSKCEASISSTQHGVPAVTEDHLCYLNEKDYVERVKELDYPEGMIRELRR